MVGVRICNVSKTLGAHNALTKLNLDVQPGEFLTLLGPSGCGKSTTLNLLSGLLVPDEGEIYFGDKLVNRLTPDKRNIAMVFQNYALYPHMTIYENLAFPLRARGVRLAEEEIRRKINETAEILGLGELLQRYPKELSGGQQQRVALGRAMIRDPEIFLLDEPLSNLDARLRIKMRKDIKSLHARLQSTIIYVTHDQSEAMTMSDRIAILHKGVLQQVASPEDIYNRPANMFVAGFVGEREINFLQGTAFERGGRVIVRIGNIELDIGDSGERGYLLNRELTLGIRGEHIRLSDAPIDGNSLPAHVDFIELEGSEKIVNLVLQQGDPLWCRVKAEFQVTRLQTVYVNFDMPKIHYFDSRSMISLAANRH